MVHSPKVSSWMSAPYACAAASLFVIGWLCLARKTDRFFKNRTVETPCLTPSHLGDNKVKFLFTNQAALPQEKTNLVEEIQKISTLPGVQDLAANLKAALEKKPEWENGLKKQIEALAKGSFFTQSLQILQSFHPFLLDADSQRIVCKNFSLLKEKIGSLQELSKEEEVQKTTLFALLDAYEKFVYENIESAALLDTPVEEFFQLPFELSNQTVEES